MGLCGTFHVIEKTKPNNSSTFDQNSTKNESSSNNDRNKIDKENKAYTEFNFNAILGEKECPIYIEKDNKIEINVLQDNESKWSFLPNEESIDFRGYNNYQYKDMNLGCLLARISTSKNYINIDNEHITFTSLGTGSLVLMANLDQNNYSFYKPDGKIKLKIIGGYSYDEDDIDELTGYKSIKYYKTENEKYLSKIYINILRYINKARSNIQKYINDFLFDYNDLDFDFKKLNNLPLCEMNKKLYEIAEEHCQDLCVNGTSGHFGTNGSSIKSRLEKNKISLKDYAECIIYVIKNPILIVNSLILHKYSKKKENRNNLFNKKFSIIGISLNKHISYGYCCVILFGN